MHVFSSIIKIAIQHWRATCNTPPAIRFPLQDKFLFALIRTVYGVHKIRAVAIIQFIQYMKGNSAYALMAVLFY